MKITSSILLTIFITGVATAQPPLPKEPSQARLNAPRVTDLYAKSLGGPTNVSPEEAARNIALQKEQIALSRAARNLISEGNYAGALEQYQKLEVLTPNAGVPRVLIGNMLFRLGKNDDAIAAYRTALERSKSLPAFVAPDAYVGIGEVYAATGRTEEAIAAYRQVIYRVPQHDWIDGNGQTVKKSLRFTKDDWKSSKGNDPQVLMRYALLLSKAGRNGEAIQAYKWGMDNITHPDRDLLNQPFNAQGFDQRRFDAAAHTALGLTSPGIDTPYEDAAITEYRLAVTSDRYFGPAHYLLGNALKAKGLQDEAKASWQKAVETGRGETKSLAQKAIEQR